MIKNVVSHCTTIKEATEKKKYKERPKGWLDREGKFPGCVPGRASHILPVHPTNDINKSIKKLFIDQYQ